MKQIAGPVGVHTSCVSPQVLTSPGLGMDRYTVTPWSLAWGLHSGASNCRAVRPELSALTQWDFCEPRWVWGGKELQPRLPHVRQSGPQSKAVQPLRMKTQGPQCGDSEVGMDQQHPPSYPSCRLFWRNHRQEALQVSVALLCWHRFPERTGKDSNWTQKMPSGHGEGGSYELDRLHRNLGNKPLCMLRRSF